MKKTLSRVTALAAALTSAAGMCMPVQIAAYADEVDGVVEFADFPADPEADEGFMAVVGALADVQDIAINEDNYELGDCNNDGFVDARDATDILVFYAAASTSQPIDDWSTARIISANVNGDGYIDSSDASDVLGYYSYVSTGGEYSLRNYIRMQNGEPIIDDTQPPQQQSSFMAPEGLYPGEQGTLKYIINTYQYRPHDEIPIYNIKYDNGFDGKPVYSTALARNPYMITDEGKAAMEKFAAEHFTPDMTNYDRIYYTWYWLHHNVEYADGKDGRPSYGIWNDDFAVACFEKKAGQCLQYNGAFAEILAYMGFNSYMLEMYMDWGGQHFRSEVEINGIYYDTEVGETASDNPPTGYKWMWLFDPNQRLFYGPVLDRNTGEPIQ